MMRRVKDVDGYVDAAPKEVRGKLLQLRKIIRAAVPEAKEGISHRIPFYNYYGALVWFAAFKNHVSIFLRPPIIQEYKRYLSGYETTKSAVHFPLNQPLPASLIVRLVKARKRKNEAHAP